MTLTQHGPSYPKFNFAELRAAARAKGINAMTNDRRQLIRTLREAGRAATFRFFDLPVEIRYLVYEYAFDTVRATRRLHDVPKVIHHAVKADLQVLAACKQTYTERSHVFYQNQVFHMATYLGRNYNVTIYLNAHRLDRVNANWLASVHLGALSLGQYLKQVQDLHLKVKINLPNFPDPIRAINGLRLVNDALHRLYQATLRAQMDRVRFDIKSSGRYDEEQLRRALSPIPILASRITTWEFGSTNISNKLRRTMKEPAEGFGTVRSLHKKLKEVVAATVGLHQKDDGIGWFLGRSASMIFPQPGEMYIYDGLKEVDGEKRYLKDMLDRISGKHEAAAE